MGLFAAFFIFLNHNLGFRERRDKGDLLTGAFVPNLVPENLILSPICVADSGAFSAMSID